MSRTTSLLIVGCALVGCVVAAVRAQESSRRKPSVYKPAPIEIPAEPVAPVPVEDTSEPPRKEGSVLNSFRKPQPPTNPPAAPEMDAPEEAAPEETDDIGPIGVPRPGPRFQAAATDDEPRMAAAPGDATEEAPLKSILKRGQTPAPTPAANAPTPAAPRTETPQPKAAPTTVPESTTSSRRPATNAGGFQPKAGAKALAGSIQETNLTVRSPQLKIDTRGPLALTLGKPAAYTLEVLNEGEVSAQDVQIRVQFPSWVTVATTTQGAQVQNDPQGGQKLNWTVTQLDSRYKKTLNFQVTANDGKPFEMQVDWAVRPAGQKAQVVVKQPRLEVAITGPGEMNYGEEKKFVVTVSNPGNGEAENVVLTFNQVGGRSQRVDVGLIQAGHQKEVPVQISASQAGEIQLQAAAVGDGELQAEAASKVLVRRPELALTMEGPPLKFSGAEATYLVTVTNTGNAGASDVTAAVTLPQGSKYVGGIEGAAVVPGGIKWRVGNIAQGAERTYEFKCQLAAAGVNRLDSQVRGPGGLSAGAAVETEVEAVADLKMTLNDPSGPVSVGEEITYELQVVNRGTMAAEQVKIVMHFSEGIEPTGVEGAVGKVAPGQIVCTPLPQLGAGEQLSIKIKARGEAAGNHLYRVEVFAGEPETRLVSEGTTRFFADGAKGAPGRNVRKPAATPAPGPVRR